MAEKRIHRFRFVAACILLTALAGAIAWCVSITQDSSSGWLVAISGGLVFTLIPASVLEWLVHRYIYHRHQSGPLGQIYRIHHQGHHAAIFPTWRYTTNGPVCRHPVGERDITRLYPAGWRNLLSKLAHFGFYMTIGAVAIWTPAWLLTGNRIFLATIVVTSAILSDLFVRVHDAIHYPGQF